MNYTEKDWQALRDAVNGYNTWSPLRWRSLRSLIVAECLATQYLIEAFSVDSAIAAKVLVILAGVDETFRVGTRLRNLLQPHLIKLLDAFANPKPFIMLFNTISITLSNHVGNQEATFSIFFQPNSNLTKFIFARSYLNKHQDITAGNLWETVNSYEDKSWHQLLNELIDAQLANAEHNQIISGILLASLPTDAEGDALKNQTKELIQLIHKICCSPTHDPALNQTLETACRRLFQRECFKELLTDSELKDAISTFRILLPNTTLPAHEDLITWHAAGLSWRKLLGYGGFGRVDHVTASNGTDYVVKTILDKTTEEKRDIHEKERDLLRSLNHPNIVQACTFSNPSIFAMELLAGSLFDRINAQRLTPTETQLRYARDAAAGLAYLHGTRITHGDISYNNFAIDSNGTGKWIDFGNAHDFNKAKPQQTQNIFWGALIFAAAEFFDSTKNTEFKGDIAMCFEEAASADVYSLGLLLFYIFTGKTFADDVKIGKETPYPEMHRQLISIRTKQTASLVPSPPRGTRLLFEVTPLCHEVPSERLTAASVVEQLKTITLR